MFCFFVFFIFIYLNNYYKLLLFILIDYCYRDLRIAHREQNLLELQNLQSNSPTRSRATSRGLQRSNSSTPSLTYDIYSEMANIEEPVLTYPQNLTLSHLFYFSIIPTLCYQLNYPRSPNIRIKYIITLIIRMIFIIVVILYVVKQHIIPALEEVMKPIHNKDIFHIIQQFIHISLPNTYVWLLGFYFLFHLWLNFLAEITRFGDREFYRDWWNAKTFDEYWRLWNLPVHYWMLRHLYYPLIRSKLNKFAIILIIFLFSAVLHEVIISVPFRRISYHSFAGMLFQAPLVILTRKFNNIINGNNNITGNIIFWVIFCIIGQPVGVVMYYYESWIAGKESN